MKISILIPMVFILSSCSYKGLYEQIQTTNRVECGKQPSSQYEDCVEGSSKTYEEYENERQEALSE
jgi:hypothetical protein